MQAGHKYVRRVATVDPATGKTRWSYEYSTEAPTATHGTQASMFDHQTPTPKPEPTPVPAPPRPAASAPAHDPVAAFAVNHFNKPGWDVIESSPTGWVVQYPNGKTKRYTRRDVEMIMAKRAQEAGAPATPAPAAPKPQPKPMAASTPPKPGPSENPRLNAVGYAMFMKDWESHIKTMHMLASRVPVDATWMDDVTERRYLISSIASIHRAEYQNMARSSYHTIEAADRENFDQLKRLNAFLKTYDPATDPNVMPAPVQAAPPKPVTQKDPISPEAYPQRLAEWGDAIKRMKQLAENLPSNASWHDEVTGLRRLVRMKVEGNSMRYITAVQNQKRMDDGLSEVQRLNAFLETYNPADDPNITGSTPTPKPEPALIITSSGNEKPDPNAYGAMLEAWDREIAVMNDLIDNLPEGASWMDGISRKRYLIHSVIAAQRSYYKNAAASRYRVITSSELKKIRQLKRLNAFLKTYDPADDPNVLKVNKKPVFTPKKPTAEVNTPNPTVAAQIRRAADAMSKTIHAKRNPAIASLNVTHRRAGIASSMRDTADKLERQQQILYGLAASYEQGSVPEILSGVKTRPLVEQLVNLVTHMAYWESLNIKYNKPAKESRKDLLNRLELSQRPTNPPSPMTRNRMYIGSLERLAELREALNAMQTIGMAHKPPTSTKVDRELEELERSIIGRKIPGFFATSAAVASKMLDHAHIESGMTVLEPSAGKGNLANAIVERHPDVDVSVIEPNSTLRQILELQGHDLVDDNSLNHRTKYDRVIMNPPFENFQDIDHVEHAFKHQLKPGGRLVAIMSESPFFRNESKARAFRDWLEHHGGVSEPIEQGNYGNDHGRATNVKTRMIVIDKPEN